MSELPLADDEIVYRVIRSSAGWFEPPDKIFSNNFALRTGETGLSVYRARMVSADELLSRMSAESLIVQAMVGDIRKAQSAAHEPLNLDVVPDDPDGRNSGHAEIRAFGGKFGKSAAKALQRIFRLHPRPSS